MFSATYPLELPLHLLSVLLVAASTLMAIYLIPIAGKARAWWMLSAALVLLAMDSMAELLAHAGLLLDMRQYEIVRDVFGVAEAVLIFGGVFYVRALFVERRFALRKLELQLDELQQAKKVSDGKDLRLQELLAENEQLKARLDQYQK